VSGRGLAATLSHWPFAFLILLIVVLRGVATWRALNTTFSPEDFSVYYCAGLTLRHGGNPYRTPMAPLAKSLGLEKGYIAQTNDPTPFLLCFAPLTLLSPHQAYWAWQAISAVALLAAVFLLFWPAYSGLSGPTALTLAGFAVLFPPVGNNFALAQSKTFVLLAMVAMMRCLQRNRGGFAGLMLAVAGLLRIFPLVMGGYLVLMRRWRVVAYTIGAIAAGAVATVAIAGVVNSLSFFTAAGALSSERWLSEPSNISVAAFISRIFWSMSGNPPSASLEIARRATVLAADLVVMYFVVKATLSMGLEDLDGRIFSLWIVASVMVSPTAWFHYLLLMLIPFAQMASAAFRGTVSARTIWMAVACYLLIGLTGDLLALVAHNWELVEKIREVESLCLLIAFVAVYWFATDLPQKPLGIKTQSAAGI